MQQSLFHIAILIDFPALISGRFSGRGGFPAHGLLQCVRGQLFIQAPCACKAAVRVNIAHADALFKIMHSLGGKECALSAAQPPLAILRQPQTYIGIVQNIFFVFAKLPGTAIKLPGNIFVFFDIVVAMHIPQLIGGGRLPITAEVSQ